MSRPKRIRLACELAQIADAINERSTSPTTWAMTSWRSPRTPSELRGSSPQR